MIKYFKFIINHLIFFKHQRTVNVFFLLCDIFFQQIITERIKTLSLKFSFTICLLFLF